MTIWGAGVFDETAARWLTRVGAGRAPAAGEYTMDEDGNHTFSADDKDHVMLIRWDDEGPRVTVFGKNRKVRA